MAVGLLVGTATYTAKAAEKAKSKLEVKAKITKAEAKKTALAKVLKGKVKEGELEEENGKLVWSFDIASPGTKDITEEARSRSERRNPSDPPKMWPICPACGLPRPHAASA